MRARFAFRAEGLALPIAYHRILQGVIYNNLKDARSYSDFVHDRGYAFGQRRYPLFCFSELTGPCVVANKTIRFLETVCFEVSSPEVYLIRTLTENIAENGIRFLDRTYPNVEVFLSDYEIEETQLLVKTLSPITTYSTDPYTGKTRYYAPEDALFMEMLNDNFQRKYTAYTGGPPQSRIYIVPEPAMESRKCVTRYKGIYITAYHGAFRLLGERKYINFLYQAGIGAKNAQGFGMVEEIVEGIYDDKE